MQVHAEIAFSSLQINVKCMPLDNSDMRIQQILFLHVIRKVRIFIHYNKTLLRVNSLY